MQFLVTAYDAKEEGTLEKRLEAREEHLKGVERLFEQKKHLYAAALLFYKVNFSIN